MVGRGGRGGAVLSDAGLELVQLGAHPATVDGGDSAACDVIAARVSAVVAFNDVIAIGLIRRLQRMGVRVPADLSVIGFDNTYLAELVSPSLTSVDGDLAGLGRAATDLLLRRLADGAPDAEPEPVTLPTRLAVRDSTAAHHPATH